MVALAPNNSYGRLLRNPELPSGYACVYPKQDCRPQFMARPFRGLHLGNYPDARTAADAASDWWYQTYGPDWLAFFRCRSRLAWHALRTRGPVTVLKSDGRIEAAPDGYRLVCWELGVWRPVFPPPAKSGPSPSAFATRAFAKRYFRDWRVQEFGDRHPLVIRQSAWPVTVPGWARARGGAGFPTFRA